MSDEEEESMSEGFSASEEEWKPNKEARDGESSDDDDSDFEEVPKAATSGRNSSTIVLKKDTKLAGVLKQQSMVKKRKPAAQSLRAKLYNKYRPPPKTFPSPSSGQNSPSASTSKGQTKNYQTPNEANDDSDTDGSVVNYLINPDDIDFQSSFYQGLRVTTDEYKKVSPTPVFDCNAGMKNLSDSDSEDNNDSSNEERKTYDFQKLLDNANSLERFKQELAQRKEQTTTATIKTNDNNIAMDVSALLALGENLTQKQKIKSTLKTQISDECEDVSGEQVSKLNKTKSTRVKRHTKTRPTSTVAAGDTDDSELEEVADNAEHSMLPINDLEIHVELPGKHNKSKGQTKDDLELALRRKINRNLRERQLLLHKASLLCQFGRSYYYNRLLNDMSIMQMALKLLPSKNSYPTERGTEIKYFASLATWYKTTMKLLQTNVYPEYPRMKLKRKFLKKQLMEQIQEKKARCKQDMIFIFVALLRGMGFQCRLVINMQPLPLKPPSSNLLTLKLQHESDVDENKEKKVEKKKLKSSETSSKYAEQQDKSKNVTKSKSTTRKRADKDVQQIAPLEKRTKPSRKTEIKNLDEVEAIEKTKIEQKRATRARTALNMEKPHENFAEAEESKPRTRARKTAAKSNITELPQKEIENLHETSINKGKPNLSKLTQASPVEKSETVLKETQNLLNKRTRSKKNAMQVPKIVEPDTEVQEQTEKEKKNVTPTRRESRSRSHSPKLNISPRFLQTKKYMERISPEPKFDKNVNRSKKTASQVQICTEFLQAGRTLRKRNKVVSDSTVKIPQLDGADDSISEKKNMRTKRPQLKKLNKSRSKEESDEDFAPSPPKQPKAPKIEKQNRSVLSSTDDEATNDCNTSGSKPGKKNACDLWVEAWSDLEEQWVCIDIFSGKIHSVDAIRKMASSNMAYVFAFQNDLSLKDVTARYCVNWSNIVRKWRVDKSWLSYALAPYRSKRTKRDIIEDRELRRIQEEKPMPTTISEYKDHPLYVLERHLLKFQAIYPPNAPTLGFVRNEPVYARECVHTLHSREIWVKEARVVKPGETAYKIVKARPKWDRMTQSVIKDQPLEIFGYWQTQDYDPPTAENGIVPRNEYGNVELFKACMLPKKCVHLRLPGLQRICKKLGIDCANAVIGFDFHQGSCHPEFDGFVVCEEYKDTVIDAWHEDQQQQERKEREKREARVYGNWKKLIRGLLIRERLKTKYNY